MSSLVATDTDKEYSSGNNHGSSNDDGLDVDWLLHSKKGKSVSGAL